MGWWSACVMGGDAPLDALGLLADLMGVPYGETHGGEVYGYPITKKHVEDNMNRLINAVNDNVKDETVGQVLGVIVLETGAKLEHEHREVIVNAIKKDRWANEEGWSSERGAELHKFYEAIMAHREGHTTSLKRESLLGHLYGVTNVCNNQ